MENIPLQENSIEKLYVATLASGEKVYDRPNGHIHESVKIDMPAIIPHINAYRRDFITEIVTLEGRQWISHKVEVDSNKDDLFLIQRVGREGLSVFVRNRKTEMTDQAVVVLSRNDTRRGQPEGYAIMYDSIFWRTRST
jgi:hypothetical protein